MKYEIHLTSKDMFGQDVVDNLLELGKLGAVKKEGTFAHMKFPYTVYLEVEAEEPPMPSAQIRVFDHKKKEVFAKALEEQRKEKEKAEQKEAKKAESKASNFSVEQEDKDDEDEGEADNSLATNDQGEPWTKEQLEDLEWSVFKKVVATRKIKGRDRVKMQRQYLEAVEKESESQ